MSIISLLGQATASEIAANDSRATSLTSAAFDLREYVGDVLIVIHSDAASAGTNPTLTCKMQDSATTGGSYADISGATFTVITTSTSYQVIVIKANAVKRFLKFIGTIGGTSSPAFTYGVSIIGMKQTR